ncbi:hypothetical protein Bca101_075541 [Brassica carinata]
MVPLYGAGADIAASGNNGGVPVKLEFEIRSRANIVGSLVKSRHRKHLSCFFLIYSNTKFVKFTHKTYQGDKHGRTFLTCNYPSTLKERVVSKQEPVREEKMMDATSESERTSLDLSISSPKQAYYVESPSSVSQVYDGDKSSSAASLIQVQTPNYTILTESRLSSSSRTSNGTSGVGFRWKGSSRRRDMYWLERHYTIDEEEVYEDNRGLSVGQCRAVMVILGIVVVFSVFCSVLWGASHPFSPIVSVKSFSLHSFYYGEGIDRTGVATKILSFNSSVKVTIDSPAPYFGIHVSSSSTFNLTFSALTLATGQLKSYYQPRKSKHTAIVKLIGSEVPLYGAGPNLAASDKKGRVPVKLEFEIRSQGNLLGKLVKSNHLNHISCSFYISSSKTSKPIEFTHKTCKHISK